MRMICQTPRRAVGNLRQPRGVEKLTRQVSHPHLAETWNERLFRGQRSKPPSWTRMQASVGVSKRAPVSRIYQQNEELVPMHDIPLPPFRALNDLTRCGSRFCGCVCNHPASAPTPSMGGMHRQANLVNNTHI